MAAVFFKDLLTKRVSVVTNDGKHYVGVLRSYDQKTNLVLTDCVERQYSLGTECRLVDQGLLVLRGENVAIAGELSAESEQDTDLSEVRAAPLPPITH